MEISDIENEQAYIYFIFVNEFYLRVTFLIKIIENVR